MGIVPREISSLSGIFTAHFIHGNLIHLIANSSGLLILGFIFLTVEGSRSFLILLILMLLGGLGTWIIGRSHTVHIGSSGVVYSLIAYLLFLGIFSRKVKLIAISFVVFFLYGGAIWGILPSSPYISWEGHLSGFVAGIVVSKCFSKGSEN